MKAASCDERGGMPPRRQQTIVRTRLAWARIHAGLTQAEMAWAIGVSRASYVRLDRGKVRNPSIGWLVNAAIVLGYDVTDLIDLVDDEVLEWHRFDRLKPPSPEWRERPEVLARARHWRAEEEQG